MAVDHDLFSFVDKKFPEMPVILITNPKDARFIVPEKEPIERILKSTHIRYEMSHVAELFLQVFFSILNFDIECYFIFS